MNKGKIDLNTILGFVLIGAIFLYFGYFQSSEENLPENTTEQVTDDDIGAVSEENAPNLAAEAADSDTLPLSIDSTLIAEEEFFTLENDLLKLTLTTKGGMIKQAELKNYQTYDSLPLHLINDNTIFNINLQGGAPINTADAMFRAEKEGDDQLRMVLDLGGGKRLEYLYGIEEGSYLLNWDVKSYGLANRITEATGLQWEMLTLRHEKNKDTENQYTRAKYLHAEDDIDDLSPGGEDEDETSDLRWLAYKQQFFSSILWNKESKFNKAVMASNVVGETEETYTKHFVSKLSVAKPGTEISLDLGFFLGPNKYELLKSYDQQFDELIPLGWGILGWINRGIVINVFNWLAGYGLNYGIIILVIALLIKVILFPLTYQSYRSMAKMRVLKPEMDELNEQYKDKDAVKKQQAVMEMYQKAGVNPLGGCIPVVLQLPILIALFRFFPASIELRQQSFLWADDLSSYDSIAQLPFNIPFYGDHVSLFTLLMTVSTLIYTYMNNQLSGTNQQYPQMKYIMYFMPIIFLGVFNNYASGLSYYYFVANMITFGQQFFIRRSLNDEKIHAKIQAKREQPKKENRFMRRMKELQEDQNRSARRRKN